MQDWGSERKYRDWPIPPTPAYVSTNPTHRNWPIQTPTERIEVIRISVFSFLQLAPERILTNLIHSTRTFDHGCPLLRYQTFLPPLLLLQKSWPIQTPIERIDKGSHRAFSLWILLNLLLKEFWPTPSTPPERLTKPTCFQTHSAQPHPLLRLVFYLLSTTVT